jgi:chromosome segregation ATPase
LSTYPESASCKTQFGELPLHLAVECGAAPEVVNLLIVANWDGIIAYDQSGRTPMEMLDSTELLEQEDHRIVYESLVRCHTAYTNFQKAALEEQSAIKKKHMAKFCEVKRRHDDELKREQQKKNEIRGQVRHLEGKIDTLNEGLQSRDEKIASFHAEEKKWKDHIQALELLVAELKNDFMQENEMVKSLINAVQDKDKEILQRDRKIQTLSNDLLDVLAVQEDEIAFNLTDTERSMRAMVSNQIALQKKVVGQTQGLKDLLSARGIASRTNAANSFPSQGREEQKHHEMEEQIDETNVASAVLGAAVAALQKPPQLTM